MHEVNEMHFSQSFWNWSADAKSARWKGPRAGAGWWFPRNSFEVWFFQAAWIGSRLSNQRFGVKQLLVYGLRVERSSDIFATQTQMCSPRTHCSSGQVFYWLPWCWTKFCSTSMYFFFAKRGLKEQQKLPESSGNDSRIIPSWESMGTPLLRDD